MPIIAAFNSKGGSAKSTAILVLGDALARQGASVSIIDTDPQASLAIWRERAKTSTIQVVRSTSSTSIHRVIREESARSAWVLIDMAGFTSDMRPAVMSRTDLVIVPMQASPEDARLAATALEYIASDCETLDRTIRTRILWARTVPKMIQRVERKILDQMAAANIPAFETHLNERSAFRAMFLEGAPLAEVDQSQFNGVPKAIENADRLASEVASFFLPMEQAA